MGPEINILIKVLGAKNQFTTLRTKLGGARFLTHPQSTHQCFWTLGLLSSVPWAPRSGGTYLAIEEAVEDGHHRTLEGKGVGEVR